MPEGGPGISTFSYFAMNGHIIADLLIGVSNVFVHADIASYVATL